MDLKLDKIDWPKTDEEEIYDIYDDLDLVTDKVQMVLYLMQHHPTLELSYIEMIEETTSELLFNHKHELVEQMANTYAKYLPNEYATNYQYLEKDLLDYYFYVDNIEKIEERLQYIKKNPVKGVDIVTIPVLYQLIYHGYFSQALEYSKTVWQPLFNSDEIWGNAHAPFCTTIYLHELELTYNKIQDGQSVDVKDFYNTLNKVFEIDEDNDGKQTIFYCLQNPFSKDEINNLLKEQKHRKAILQMNIWFLVYMKKKFDVPFILSDLWWNTISTPKVYGDEGLDNYFYIPYNVLGDHFSNHYDHMMASNQTEMFGKINSLEYVYHFIKECGLIGKESYNLMIENIKALKYTYTNLIAADLWQMTYLFKWPQLYYPDNSIEKIYRDTFCFNDDSYKIALDNFQQLTYNFLRPDLRAEIDTFNNNMDFEIDDFDEDQFHENLKMLINDDGSYDEPEHYLAPETYVKSEPDVGRNDPCPCGSGKKYKKCCLNK